MTARLLVTDLDNTLYDWVGYFVPAFYAMVEKAVEITGCDRERLLDDLREVHRRHHDSEHPYALLETQSMREHFLDQSTEDMAAELDEAFHAFNSVRKSLLTLYPGVEEGLATAKSSGIRLVAHTESKLAAVVDRLTRLGITDYFDAIFCIERPVLLLGERARPWSKLDTFPIERVRELSHHQRKPDPDVLQEICRTNGALPSETIYVGDSLTRDMILARRAGTMAVWARYGTRHDSTAYQKLVRVSHWTRAEVERENALRSESSDLVPDAILDRGFDEIIPLLKQPLPVSAPSL
jgi:FMN phosphatase YigB (HAD superfamily)